MTTTLTVERTKELVDELKGWFDEYGELLNDFAIKADGDFRDPAGDGYPAEAVDNIDRVIETAQTVTEFLVELKRLKRFFEWAKTMPAWEDDLPE